jgi:hypothetical protein
MDMPSIYWNFHQIFHEVYSNCGSLFECRRAKKSRGTGELIGTFLQSSIFALTFVKGRSELKRIILTALLFFGVAANIPAQSIPKWELMGGYSEDLAGAGIAGQKQLPTNGTQVEFDRVVTSYFRVTSQFNAQFADHVVNIAPPPPPGGSHVNGKELLGLFGPEATYRGLRKFDIFGHYLIGLAYGRDNQFPKIPTATYTTWAYALGGGVDMKLARRVSARLFGFDWITTHFPVNSPEAQDNWRIDAGFVFHLGN